MFSRRACLAVFLAPAALFAQKAVPTLQITGAVTRPLTLTAEDLAAMPRASVKTSGNGRETVYEGVWLHEVLKRARMPYGKALRGQALAGYVVAEARDGYRVVFSFGEIDPAFTRHGILLADTADGKPLFGAHGPFRLVVPQDRRGARSVRMLAKLEVVRLSE